MTTFTESVVERVTLSRLKSNGWAAKNGTEIATGEPGDLRTHDVGTPTWEIE